MAPEEARTAAQLARLRREVSLERAAMDRHAADAHDVMARWGDAPPERPYLVVGAVALHAWYTGLETLLERAARQIDEVVPTGETSHRDLLSQMMTAVPGLRPALLSPAHEAALLELLSFRHFFRHAYAVELDPDKLRVNLSTLLAVEPEVRRSLEAFDRFLENAIAAIEPR